MASILRVFAIFLVAAKRLLSQRGLALATLLGLITSVTLVMSSPLYADVVYRRVLGMELVGEADDAYYPPFAFMFRYIGTWDGPVQWEDVQQVDAYLSGQLGSALGLPHTIMARYFETDVFRMFPHDEIAYADVRDPLIWTRLAFLSDMEEHATLLEGNWPSVAASSPDSAVEVLVSDPVAQRLGLHVGEEYVLFRRKGNTGEGEITQILVRVAGIWTATDPEEEYWFYRPAVFEERLLVPEATFAGRIAPYLDDEVNGGVWYVVMDGSGLHASQVSALVGRITAAQQRASSLLPNIRLDISPVESLQEYQRVATLLTILLYAFSIPVVGLILMFISLNVGLSVQNQRNEIAVWRSRGATKIQVIGIAVLEAAILGAFALLAGSCASGLVAQAIGKARSFLDFSAPSYLRVGVTTNALKYGLSAAAIALIAQMLPTLAAARHTIVTYKQEQARSRQRVWWLRAWLDVLVLIAAAYGFHLLRQQGGLAVRILGSSSVSDPFQNPLLFLVPSLGILGVALLVLRLIPPLMTAVAWLASKAASLALLLAARYLSRTPSLYAAPLLLLVLTLSLSTYTASVAQTLDEHLYDQVQYAVGADMWLAERGESPSQSAGYGAMGPVGGQSAAAVSESEPYWVFLPVSEHLKVPGVQAAARVGSFAAYTGLSGEHQELRFIGIDRTDFPEVAFWRRDFAPVSLGALMNELALAPDGVLVPRGFMAQHALSAGDTIRVIVDTSGQRNALDMKIVGAFDLFPTWYPDEEAILVGNLDHLFEQAGGEFPYAVWLKTDANVDYDTIVEDLRGLHLTVADWRAARLEVDKEQQRPERQGLFGLLSVGYVAAAVLTVLGFLLYALFSFRRRFIELGILRAVGLSPAQMTRILAGELAFLILMGLAAGTLLGVGASRLFIPYLQIGAEASARIPPFIPQIAWSAVFRIYALFALLFFIALAVLAILLLRMKIFEAIKLGETT